MIEKLTWDSDFFEKRIGRLIINDEKEFDPQQFKKIAERDFDLVYVFSYEKVLSLNNVLSSNLELIDIILTMSMPFNKNNYLQNSYKFRTSLTEKEIMECYDIADQISIVSRFYKEPLIGPEKTRALYRKWIDNAINKTFSDGLFLEKNNNKVVGIHIIKTTASSNSGAFTLTGVNNNHFNLGIGSKLWNQSFAYWAENSEVRIVKSSFSLFNKSSFNFHLKADFNKLEETKYIYHYRNSQEK